MKAMDDLLQQLVAACAEIDEQIAVVRQEAETRIDELSADRARLDAARLALAPGSSAGPPMRANAKSTAPSRAKPRSASTSTTTPEHVLEWMREHGREWVGSGQLVRAFGLTSKTIQVRLTALIERGAVEQKGELAARRYRLAPTDDAAQPELDDDGDEQLPGVSARVRRQLEHESRPASVAPTPLAAGRPTGPVLRRKIEERLRRQTCFPSELAKSLVVPMQEVTQQIAVLRELGGQGSGPKVLKHESGAYFIDEDEASKWPLERAA